MNKKIIKLGFFLIIFFKMEIQAQKLQGISSIGLQLAKSDFGYMVGADYQRYLKRSTVIQIEGYYEMSNYLNMNHSSYYLNTCLLYDFLDSRDKHVILFGGGLTGNYDELDKSKLLGETFVRKSMNVGLLSKIQYEFYLSKKLMFNSFGVFNYNFVTDFAKTKFWGGIGINYIIY